MPDPACAAANRWNVAKDDRAHYVLLSDALAMRAMRKETVKASCGARFRPRGEWLVERDVGIVRMCVRCRAVLERDRGA